jgi:taurine transport system substrate-binding protein
MKFVGKSAVLALATGVSMMGAGQASALDEITVAYFLEWPMPFQYARQMGTYEEELGVAINWRAFDTGTAMSAAMASGDVHISVSQGVPPFVVAASAGQDLQIVDVAVSYSNNDNCVVHADREIDASNVGDLAGARVGVPIGTAAHYGFLRQMGHFGIDVSSLEVVDMAPADSAAALAQGSLDMACGWGGALRRMLEHGNVLLTGEEKEALGIYVLDVTSVPASFAEDEPELLAGFVGITARMNAMWLRCFP